MEYEPYAIPYIVHSEHKYTPDFTYSFHKDGRYCHLLLEVKGFFRTRAEANKYLHIIKSLDKFTHFMFVFQNMNSPMPGAKRRKCGTKQSMSEWSYKQGIACIRADNITAHKVVQALGGG